MNSISPLALPSLTVEKVHIDLLRPDPANPRRCFPAGHRAAPGCQRGHQIQKFPFSTTAGGKLIHGNKNVCTFRPTPGRE